ncbi:MAG: hypothetical protein ACI3ZC_09990 [Candidatus Cryptobacteroides sp.]
MEKKTEIRMNNIRYQDIRDISGIEKAQACLSGKIRSKEREIAASYGNACDYYSPAGLLAHGIKKVSGKLPVDRILLTVIRIIKRRIR